jgi:hypothetical protein
MHECGVAAEPLPCTMHAAMRRGHGCAHVLCATPSPPHTATHVTGLPPSSCGLQGPPSGITSDGCTASRSATSRSTLPRCAPAECAGPATTDATWLAPRPHSSTALAIHTTPSTAWAASGSGQPSSLAVGLCAPAWAAAAAAAAAASCSLPLLPSGCASAPPAAPSPAAAAAACAAAGAAPSGWTPAAASPPAAGAASAAGALSALLLSAGLAGGVPSSGLPLCGEGAGSRLLRRWWLSPPWRSASRSCVCGDTSQHTTHSVCGQGPSCSCSGAETRPPEHTLQHSTRLLQHSPLCPALWVCRTRPPAGPGAGAAAPGCLLAWRHPRSPAANSQRHHQQVPSKHGRIARCRPPTACTRAKQNMRARAHKLHLLRPGEHDARDVAADKHVAVAARHLAVVALPQRKGVQRHTHCARRGVRVRVCVCSNAPQQQRCAVT